jgi:MFS family permease
MKYGFNEDQAGKLIAIPYYISAGFSPLFGFTVDKIGRRVIFITISSIILISAFTLSMLMPSCPE